MADGFRSKEARLNKLITDVENMKNTLEKRVRNIQGHADEIGVAWRGEAATQYRDTQNKANAYAEKLKRQLADMEEMLRLSKDGFTREELRQVSDYKGLAGKSPISDFT